ncbi:hypothetical protein RZS08_09395 [Arthrospira platensis SPKY1]|nr:hypothetical protein [Arthrospira platensis SPKY1]
MDTEAQPIKPLAEEGMTGVIILRLIEVLQPKGDVIQQLKEDAEILQVQAGKLLKIMVVEGQVQLFLKEVEGHLVPV